jgi:hypothetical protein
MDVVSIGPLTFSHKYNGTIQEFNDNICEYIEL